MEDVWPFSLQGYNEDVILLSSYVVIDCNFEYVILSILK